MITDSNHPKIEELRSLTGLKSSRPDVPVSIAIQEAMDLYAWCASDKDVLIKSGFDWKFADELPLRAEVLSSLQTSYAVEKLSRKDCQLEWKAALPQARNLKAVIIHYFYHAFSGIPGEYSKVQEFARMNAIHELIQCLLNLATLGDKHREKLEGIGMDLNLLEKARKSSFEMGELQAKVTSANKEGNASLMLRNKAYYHLKEAVLEVRRYGKFVFRNNDQRYKGYTSSFMHTKYKRSKSKTQKINTLPDN